MRTIGKVKYNGKSTADLGVIVSGEASFDAAAPDYTSYQIPGKNGDLMLSNNRYLNIDVTYPAFIPADFEEKVQAIRSWMRSARSYARIEDNYDLLHFRLGMGKDVLPFEPSAENVGSNMSLVFDCKPQRFLYSGEEENQIGVWGPVQAASGDVVTFEDDENGAFKSISASITPTQDLHGYDYPWPPGGGKNKVPKGENITYQEITYTVQDNGEVVVTGTATGTSFWGVQFTIPAGTYILNGCPQGGGSSTYLLDVRDAVGGAGIAGIIADVGSGSTFTLTDDLTAYLNIRIASGYSAPSGGLKLSPMIRLSSVIDPTFTPYSNICPITGRTEATVWRTGKNLLADTNFRDSFVANDITFTRVSGGHYKVSGTCTSTTWLYIMSSGVNRSNIPVSLPTGTYTLSSGNPKVYCYFYRGDGDSDYVYGIRSVTSENMPVTSVKYLIRAGATFDDDDIYLQLNKGTADTPYTPYSGSTYPISWQTEAGTVYGGTVDVVSGVLTVDMVEVDLGTMNFIYYPDNQQMRTNYLPVQAKSGTFGEPSGILCSIYKSGNYGYNGTYDGVDKIIYLHTGGSLRINDYAYTDAAEFKAAMSGVQFVYALATPQTYQLSGQHIKTLLGLNNVWADSGTVTAEWGEDPFGLYNPTLFDALPLIKVKNPQNGCAVTVNGTTMTCSRGHTGTVTIDCELMDVSSGATNLNADWSKDFPKLSPGENSVAFSGADAVTIIPRWWEL